MLNKIGKYFKNPKLIILYTAAHGFFDWMDDLSYLKMIYKIKMNKDLDFNNVQTFNEKLQWLKVNDRQNIYTKMVDKYKVKEYVSSLIGEEYVIPTLGIYDRFDAIDFNKLPNQFVIKCTHDSGGLIICHDKKSLNMKKSKKKIEKSLRRNYFYNFREWPYKNVEPKIIIEKYMSNNNSKELMDYKFMCFNGEVKCSFVCSDRYGEGLKVDFFDREWNKMPFTRHYPNSSQEIKKPKNYNTMIELAEKLASKIPFVRVDFYEINGKVYFGELTFFPGSGFEEFTPEEWDYKLGEMIKLPQRKISQKR